MERPSEPLLLYLQRYFQPELMPVDPLTLVDLPEHPRLLVPGLEATTDAGQLAETRFVASADGSTVAALTHGPAGGVVRVLDTRTRRLRAEIRLPVGMGIEGIAPDGSRLVASGGMGQQEWQLFSTADGRRLAGGRRVGAQWGTLYDWQRDRAYLVTVPGAETVGEFVAPHPPVLVAYELASGREVGRLVLEGLLAGSVEIKRVGAQTVEQGRFGPSAALSPDGRRIVLLHGDEDKLTIVDTQTLAIAATRELRSQKNPLKAGAAVRGWSMQFAPDGLLYAVGSEQALVVEADTPPVRYLGVRLIDIEEGMIRAEALIGEDLGWALLAPDGSAVYFFGSRSPDATPDPATHETPTLLRRLDPHTLRVAAERELTGFYTGFMLAAAAP